MRTRSACWSPRATPAFWPIRCPSIWIRKRRKKAYCDGASVLAVFQGADSYVTPSWYQTKRETGKVVPTWNYAIVQARGAARIVEDAEWLLSQINAITTQHEGSRAEPWSVGDAPDDFIRAQLKGIVGVEIEITQIEGKWKVSQNRPTGDREGVAAGLDEMAGQDDMAELVRRYGAMRGN